MPSISRSNLRPAVRPKIVKKKTNKFVRIEADLFKRMAVSYFPLPSSIAQAKQARYAAARG